MGFTLDRYTSKIEKYWEDNYETKPNPQYSPDLHGSESNKPTLPKTEKDSLETPKKKPRKAKKED